MPRTAQEHLQGVRFRSSQTKLEILDFASKLRNKQIVGSYNVALPTSHLLLNILKTEARHNTFQELTKIIRCVGAVLSEAQPREFAAGSIVRKALKQMREEYQTAADNYKADELASHSSSPRVLGAQERSMSPYSSSRAGLVSSSGGVPGTYSPPLGAITSPNLSRLNTATWGLMSVPSSTVPSPTIAQSPKFVFTSSSMTASQELASVTSGPTTPVPCNTVDGLGHLHVHKQMDEFNKKSAELAPHMLSTMQEIIDDLEVSHSNVALDAVKHIHSSEIILTIGHSRTVELFLKDAAKERKFTVIVAEGAPLLTGSTLATNLAKVGIDSVLMPDSCIFAIMTRVSKVVLGAHAVLANGGMYTVSGAQIAAEAARLHATPVMVCTAQYKLCPLWHGFYECSALDFSDPALILPTDDHPGLGDVDVVVPVLDYVAPDLISVFVTNFGDHPPNSIYRLIKESYDDVDIDFSLS